MAEVAVVVTRVVQAVTPAVQVVVATVPAQVQGPMEEWAAVVRGQLVVQIAAEVVSPVLNRSDGATDLI